ncbi:MAG: MerR family transcriptional regulator, partial [Phycicoccus sp.]
LTMWSTKELAELAGTTLRAVRHYHEVGLLEEPERRSNGYKQYGVPHLLRVLRIKRLTELGFSLTQIADLPDHDHHPAEALHSLDTELAANIDRLQRARDQIGRILAGSVPTDLPPELVPVADAARLSDADRSFIVVMTRVLGPSGVQAWKDLLGDLPDHPAATAFDELPPDADDATRQDLAERLVEYVRALHAAHPGLAYDRADAPRGTRFARGVAEAAIHDLYNDAQRDVLARLRELRPDPPQ